jgi:predicted small integral membrane protein
VDRNDTTISLYELQTGPTWLNFLSKLSWIYLFMSFFEQTGLDSEPLNSGSYWGILAVELSIHFFFIVDIIIEIYYKSKGPKRLFNNKKTISKYLFEVILVIDLYFHYKNYPL